MMVTPPVAIRNKRQAAELPVTDTRLQGTTHAVEIPRSPVSPRKRAPSADLVDIKVEEDDGVFVKPLAPAYHAAKRPKAGHVSQTDSSRPELPLTPLSNKHPLLETSASPHIAASVSFQTNTLPWTPPSLNQTSGTGKSDYSHDHDSAYTSNSQILEGEGPPQIVLQSVESDDLQPDENAMFISSEWMQPIRSNTSMQSSEANQAEEHLTQSANKGTRNKSPAPEESDSGDDPSHGWRREQIMLNAVLKARDEFSILPSSWKVHFSGGPSTDRMFYRRVKERSFRPRIYAHCEKYEITGTHSLP